MKQMRTQRMRSLAIVGVALASITTACSSSGKTTADATSTTAPTSTTPVSQAPIPAPKGLPAFYSVPQPIPGKPGTLMKSAVVPAEGLHGTMLRVMYVSTNVKGAPVAVSGLIAIPSGTAPAGGFPVVSWAHGTDGMADECAPSLDPESNVGLANLLLDKGWVVTATDYLGEGTPGLHPYIAGISSARNTVDIVRAARNLPTAHASDRYVVWGHSQGGHTAMFALSIGQAYAKELKLLGVVAGAPPSQFALIYDYLKGSPFKHYLLMAAGGLNAAYGDDAPLDEVLTPAGVKLTEVLDQGCSGDVADKVGEVDIDTVVKADPFTVPKWKTVLLANDPQNFAKPSPIPLLMIQGGSDEQIPVVSTELLATHLCGIGQNLERWIYPDQTHAGVIGPSAGDMIQWITDRFAGGPNPDPYQPIGLPNVGTTTCPS
jgi:pimeloyl-ACP methyl ester carboxylesterase